MTTVTGWVQILRVYLAPHDAGFTKQSVTLWTGNTSGWRVCSPVTTHRACKGWPLRNILGLWVWTEHFDKRTAQQNVNTGSGDHVMTVSFGNNSWYPAEDATEMAQRTSKHWWLGALRRRGSARLICTAAGTLHGRAAPLSGQLGGSN